jgi:hypothetical protein
MPRLLYATTSLSSPKWQVLGEGSTGRMAAGRRPRPPWSMHDVGAQLCRLRVLMPRPCWCWSVGKRSGQRHSGGECRGQIRSEPKRGTPAQTPLALLCWELTALATQATPAWAKASSAAVARCRQSKAGWLVTQNRGGLEWPLIQAN